MELFGDILQVQNSSSEPVTVGELTATAQAQAVTVRTPFGGLVWNRPTAVLVERDGETESVPIVDVTRITQIVFIVVGLILLAKAIK